MKNPSEVVTGLVLLGLCAIGGASTAALPPPIKTEAVGPAYLPTATLAIVAFCAVLLIIFGIRNKPAKNLWGDKRAVMKALGFFVFYAVYLVALCKLGPALYYIDGFPFQHSVGFAVTNTLFLYGACRCLGRTGRLELLLIPVCVTALLILVFSIFFKVLLP